MYVDGFVLPVPRKNLDAYRRMATKAGKVWREYGAFDYKEAVADDVKKGKWTSFPQAVKLKPGEVVWFSWILYRNRKHRDAVNKKVMADPSMKEMPQGMPFDVKRMMYGGFQVIVEG